VRLEEATRHIQKIVEKKGELEPLGDIGDSLKQKLAQLEKFAEGVEAIHQRRLPELTQMMDQCEPDAIRQYVQKRIAVYEKSEEGDEKPFLAFKRSMRPFFEGKPPLLKPQREAFEEAKKEVATLLAKHEGVSSKDYDYSARYDREMRTDYLYDRMTEPERKKLHELTSLETGSKVSKTGLFFLAMQALVSLRGAAALLSGQDAAALKTRAEEMHRQMMDAIDPAARAKIEKDGSRLGALLSDKWDAMRKMDKSTLDTFLRKLSPYAQEAVRSLIHASEPPTAATIQAARDAVIAKQLATQIPSPYRHMSLGDWLKAFSAEETDLVKQELKSVIKLLQNELTQSSQEEMCYSVEKLEEQIGSLMEDVRVQLTADEKTLEKLGKKQANVILQARLVEALQLEGIQVPIPYGLASDVSEHFLRTYAPEVFSEWQALADSYISYTGSGRFLEVAASRAHLDTIVEGIQRAFQKASHDKRLFEEITTPEFRAFLEKVAQQENLLIVRSSGAEDSRHTANAGGNVSEKYVAPTQEAFCLAAATVIASYFSYGSLQNRINTGTNPFSQKLQLSVMTQELIGEAVGGDNSHPELIPRPVVLFSSEPLYVGNESFRVMRISATLGDGEGVVGERGIATDSALLLISEHSPDRLYVLYDNKEKTHRLAPVNTPSGIQLQPVENPPELRDKPVLDATLLARLYTWAVVNEKFFNDKATDMELIVKKGEIYSVQARPVIRPDLLPTYLDMKNIDKKAILQTIEGSAIVPAKASVIVAKRPGDILFTTTLKEAEAKYDKSQHQVVVVTTTEPANSHPVVNFSSLGTACLFVDPKTATHELIKNASDNHPVVIDVQTGQIILWDSSKESVDEKIVRGFAVHPAKIAISLPVADVKHRDKTEAPQEVKDLLVAIRGATERAVALDRLQQLREHPFVAAVKMKKPEGQIGFILEELENKVADAFNEMEAALKQTTDETRLRPLFHAKVLETLLLSSPKEDGSLGQYSLLHVQPLMQDAQDLIEYQKKFTHPVRFGDIYLAGNSALTSDKQQLWRSFIEEQERGAANLDELRSKIASLEKSGSLTSWITLFFTGGPLQKVLDALPDFSQNSPAALQQMPSKATQMLILCKMEASIASYDTMVKAMKQSQDLDDVAKTAQFKKMLMPYFSMMQEWLELFGDRLTFPHPHSGWAKYIETKKSGLASCSDRDPNQLRSSPQFGVNVAALGSPSAFSGFTPPPRTLEDYFTLIHQNLLAIVGNLQGQLFTADVEQQLPQAVVAAERKLFGNKIATLVTNNAIEIKYNIPLRAHSAQLVLKWDKQSEKLTLQGSIVGIDVDRWRALGMLARIAGAVGFIKLLEPPRFSQTHVEFVSDVSDTQFLGRAVEEFYNLFQISGKSNSVLIPDYVSQLVYKFPMQREEISDQFYKEIYIESSKPWTMDYYYEGVAKTFKNLPKFDQKKLEQIGQKMMERDDFGSNNYDLEFFTQLLIQDIVLDTARYAAKRGLTSQNLRRQAMLIYYYMAQKDFYRDEAMQAAIIGIDDHQKIVRNHADGVFRQLLEGGHALKEAKEAFFQHTFGTEYPESLYFTKKLFESATDMSEFFKKLQEVQQNPHISSTVLQKILKSLEGAIGQKSEQELLFSFVERCRNHPDKEVREMAVSPLYHLAKSGFMPEKLMPIAKMLLKSKDKEEKRGGYAMLRAFISNGHFLEEITSLIVPFETYDDAYEVEKTFDDILEYAKAHPEKAPLLYARLVRSEQFCGPYWHKKASDALVHLAKNGDRATEAQIMTELEQFLIEGICFTPARTTAEIIAKSSDAAVAKRAIDLIQTIDYKTSWLAWLTSFVKRK